MKRAFSRGHGFTQLKKYKGNYKWIAVPKDEWEKDIEYKIDNKCKKVGIGLLLVSGTQRLRVSEEIQPVYIGGDFLPYCKDYVESYWYE